MDARLYDVAYMTEPHSAKGAARVAATTLFVRSGPSTTYAVLGKLAEGTRVDVWAVASGGAVGAGDWYLFLGERGFPHKETYTDTL